MAHLQHTVKQVMFSHRGMHIVCLYAWPWTATYVLIIGHVAHVVSKKTTSMQIQIAAELSPSYAFVRVNELFTLKNIACWVRMCHRYKSGQHGTLIHDNSYVQPSLAVMPIPCQTIAVAAKLSMFIRGQAVQLKLYFHHTVLSSPVSQP